ncbi:MAG: PD-(D/E)XK nuclease family protein [Pseudomonadota bacterium]
MISHTHTLILTGTARLARHLRARGRQAAPEGGKAAVLPLEEWLRQSWLPLAEGESLLTPVQGLFLWEDIIAADAQLAGTDLLDRASLAYLAEEAFQLQCAFGAPPAALLGTPECQAFQRWAARFQVRLRDGGWRHPAQIPGRLRLAVAARRLPLPGRILLAGLDELSPALEMLLQSLADAGVSVGTWREEAAPAVPTLLAFADREQEVRGVAARIREGFAAGQRVGVVVPDPAAYRPLIEHIFLETFDPEALFLTAENGGQPRPVPFDITQGRPLERAPLMLQAFRILELSLRGLEARMAAELLLAPFPRGDGERCGRAQAEARLRGGAARLDLFELAQHCLLMAPGFAQRLLQLHHILRQAPARASCQAWSIHFSACLEAMGWPGDGLDRGEELALARWQEALAHFEGLAPLAGSLSRRQALSWLRRVCRHIVHQVPADSDDVQVMGLLEAAGLRFDRLFVLGMTDQAMPAAVRPHPLLPASWQRQRGLPHASPEQELHFVGALWQRLLRAAPQVVCSYPRMDGDVELGPSPLLAGREITRVEAPQRSFWQGWSPAGALAASPDDAVLPARRREGGPALLQAQANCAFQALIRHRLAAFPLEDFQTPPTARDLGTLVHRALQHFWKATKSQQTLLAMMAGGTLDDALVQCIRKALDEAGFDIDAVHRRALADSLQQLLARWMALESERPAFVVEALEQTVELQVGRLRLRMRLDRVDRQISDAARIVVDYKTGAQASSKDWLGPMGDPQMPLYIWAVDAAAGVYGKLNRERTLAWDGWGQDAFWPGLASLADWEAQRTQWRRELEALAAAFVDGPVRMLPRHGAKTCVRCGSQVFCRVQERGLAEPAMDED